MRLLKTLGCNSDYWEPQLCEFRGQNYAILSHTWRSNASHEVLFSNIKIVDDGGNDTSTVDDQSSLIYNAAFAGSAVLKPGFGKVKGTAQQALRDKYEYIWIDTCCIDKSSSAELSEAINSMWNYYRKAAICYAYMEDVHDDPDQLNNSMKSSFPIARWWTRGWTLQELIAPLELVFFNSAWDVIGEKKSLSDKIFDITGVSIDVLTNARPIQHVSIAKRMSWASKRRTTREEDLAYCLMGIFNVNMPLLYGEGQRAFLRLQEEIMKDSDDQSIFAWVNQEERPETLHGLLATHPRFFAHSGNIDYYNDFEDREPYVMSNRGLSITLPLSLDEDGDCTAALPCPVPHRGENFLAIYLRRQGEDSSHYARVNCAKLGSLKKRGPVQTIYVRQSFPTNQLETVLPYRNFQLRRGPSRETFLLIAAQYASQYEGVKSKGLFVKSADAQQWLLPGYSTTFRATRDAGEISAALMFGYRRSDEEIDETRDLENRGRFILMLGSISATQVGYDACMSNVFPPIEQLEPIFRPRVPGPDVWIELEEYYIQVHVEPKVRGENLLFVTDIDVVAYPRVRAHEINGSTAVRHNEYFDHRISTVNRQEIPERTRSEPSKLKIWQRLRSQAH